MLKRVAGALLGVSMVMCPEVDASDAPSIRSVNVCQLFQHRNEAFAGRLRVTAKAWVDLGHGAMLKSASCEQGETVDFRFSDNHPKNARTAAFDHMLTGSVMDHSLRIFDVRAVGRYTRASVASDHGMFVIENVEWFRRSEGSPDH